MLDNVSRITAEIDVRAPSGTPPIVCVQGLGFVGAAVSVAVASARDANGGAAYRVIGVDLPTPEGLARIAALNNGLFPFPTTDATLKEKTRLARRTGNLIACAEPRAFTSAAIIIVDVPFDVVITQDGSTLDLETFRSAVTTIARHMDADALIIVETTVPPGATTHVVAPILTAELSRRGKAANRFKLAHSYERVTPGDTYFGSVVNMPRVYAGVDERSATACGEFLRTIVAADCSLTRVSSTTASELGKVLENSYRAVTIAMMEEFADFAEKVDVDLFEVIAPIRARSTHSNMRTPGFGVGGYCLTKDPLLAQLAARELFGLEQTFPFASLAIDVNRAMPKRALLRLEQLLDGCLRCKRILLLGLSYRQDIGDTRYSPSQIFWESAKARGAEVIVHDPLINRWPECNITVPAVMPCSDDFDAVVLAVPHRVYKEFDFAGWLGANRPLFFDAFDVLSTERRQALRVIGCKVESIGRGIGL